MHASRRPPKHQSPRRCSAVSAARRDDQLGLRSDLPPSLPPDARVALALSSSGVQRREMRAAFLAQESAIAQRLVRAKRCCPTNGLVGMPNRRICRAADSVLEVLYLIFNEGCGRDVRRSNDQGRIARGDQAPRMIAMHPAMRRRAPGRSSRSSLHAAR